MIRYHHDVDTIRDVPLAQLGHQQSHHPINLPQGNGDLRGFWPIPVAQVVRFTEVQGYELGPADGRSGS